MDADLDEPAYGRKLMVSINASIIEAEEQSAEEGKPAEDAQDQLIMDTELVKNLKEKCATVNADFDKHTTELPVEKTPKRKKRKAASQGASASRPTARGGIRIVLWRGQLTEDRRSICKG